MEAKEQTFSIWWEGIVHVVEIDPGAPIPAGATDKESTMYQSGPKMPLCTRLVFQDVSKKVNITVDVSRDRFVCKAGERIKLRLSNVFDAARSDTFLYVAAFHINKQEVAEGKRQFLCSGAGLLSEMTFAERDSAQWTASQMCVLWLGRSQ